METKTCLILRHDSGLYLSWDRDHYPHTPKLSEARRLYGMEHLNDFLSNSHYRPDQPEEYEIVEMEIEYRLKEVLNDVPQERINQEHSHSVSQV